MSHEIKKEVLQRLISDLSLERDSIAKSAETAHAEATHPDAKPENKYDTRSLEASYLAGAQQARVDEITAKIELLKAMTSGPCDRHNPITPGALVQLESDSKVYEYLLTAWVSGYTYRIEDREIRIVSAQSPMGVALNGKKIGDSFSLTIGGQERDFDIVNIL